MHPLASAWEAVNKEFDSACSQSARAARRELTNDLNQLLRRLRQYEGIGDWVSILLECARRFVPEAAIFEVTSPNELRLRAQTGLQLPEDFTVAVEKATAFQSAIKSRDPVVALRTAAEVSQPLAQSETAARCHLIPLTNRDRVVAVLFAAGPDYIDTNALELVSGIASIVLERDTNRPMHVQLAPAQMAPIAPAVTATKQPERVKPTLPPWSELPEADRAQHLQAQRFARVMVAELQLAQPDACRGGREDGNLYLYLKRDLDGAREKFRKRFMETPSMVDYLHMELVKTAAGGDPSKLGAEYPGALA